MESFSVDKLYELPSAEELKDLWETEVDQSVPDVPRVSHSGELTVAWPYNSKQLPAVIIHDKLMTDAALGTRPIKTEHSYSLTSDDNCLQESHISQQKMDVLEDECSSIYVACNRLSECIEIKDEPYSEPESPLSSCPPSPQSSFMNTSDLHLDTEMKSPPSDKIMMQGNIILDAPYSIIQQRIKIPKVLTAIKLENGTGTFHLPPTPPSCSSSEDSEDNSVVSRPTSPRTSNLHTTRVMMNHISTRQSIYTPLISSQPKGSTGTLILTEEEKRTLIAEGYPVPTRLPLTKAEEKSLKKVRRKIKNKISAQESRKKKKEYMDELERKVEVLVSENSEHRKKIQTLEDSNTCLISQLQKLQAIVARTHPQLVKQFK